MAVSDVAGDGSPRALRSFNRARILRVIRASAGVSRVELARETGLSKPTVNKIVADLLGAGVIREVLASGTPTVRRAGPRPKLVAFRPDYGFVIGVDIGGNKLLVVLGDLAGTVVASSRSSARQPRTAADVIAELRRSIRGILDENSVRSDQIVAVSVGTPGVVDPETLRVTLAPQIEGWERVDIASEVRSMVPTRVLVSTEVQLSLLAERWRGAGQGVDDLVYINVGIGIGAAILLGGSTHAGAHGTAGEIGYMPIEDAASRRPGTDGLGTFERAAGGSAYARLGGAAARLPGGDALLELADGDPDAVDAAVVFQAAEVGDPVALKIVDELVSRLARGVAVVATVVDPALVIIGGGLSRAGAPLLERLEAHVRMNLPRPPRVVLSELGEEAVALGAIEAGIADWEAGEYSTWVGPIPNPSSGHALHEA